MSLEFVIGLFLVYSIVIYGVFKLKFKSLLKDNAELVAWIGSNSELLISKTNAINEAARKLEQMYYQVERERQKNIMMDSEVRAIHTDNIILFENNKETLKINKMELYNLRQASLFAYNEYKSIDELFRNLLVFDDGETPLFKHIRHAWELTNQNKKKVADYFESYFRISPEDYLKSKKYLTGKRENGTDFVTDYTAN